MTDLHILIFIRCVRSRSGGGGGVCVCGGGGGCGGGCGDFLVSMLTQWCSVGLGANDSLGGSHSGLEY